MKRLTILLSVVLVVLLAAAACAPKAAPAPATPSRAPAAPAVSPEEAEWAKVVAAAKKEGKVMAFTWSLAATPGDLVVKFFKDKYWIVIERVTGLTPTLIERIKSDHAAGRYVADWFDASASSNYALKAAGATEPIVGLLPVLKERGAFYSSPQLEADGHLISNNVSFFSMAINTKLVPPDQEPKSWREVIDPKWAGKVVFASPTTAPDLIYAYVLRDKLGLDEDFFRQLGKQAKMVPAGKDAASMLSRGEAHIWMTASQTMAAPMVVEGAPVKFITPREGPIQSIGNTMVRIKNGPNPNATRFFMNWLLTAEGQNVLNEARATTPLRKDVPDPVPQALKVPGEKAVVTEFEHILEISKIQSGKTLSKIMGVE